MNPDATNFSRYRRKTDMTDTQLAQPVAAQPTVNAQPADLKTRTLSIDEAFHRHVAADYWAWRAVFENDQHARIHQHPDFVLTELGFSREALHHRPTLISCLDKNKTVGAAVLVPK